MEAMSYGTYHGVKYPGDGQAGGSLLQPELGCKAPALCKHNSAQQRQRGAGFGCLL